MQSSGPEPSAYPLVTCPPSIENFYTYRSPSADIDVTTMYSERDSRYQSRMDYRSALCRNTLVSEDSLCRPIILHTDFSISVSFEVEGGEQHMKVRHKVGQTIFTTAWYKYSFVTLVMEAASMIPTTGFQHAIKEGMKNEDQSTALKDVFKKYAHTFPTEVILGDDYCRGLVTLFYCGIATLYVLQATGETHRYYGLSRVESKQPPPQERTKQKLRCAR